MEDDDGDSKGPAAMPEPLANGNQEESFPQILDFGNDSNNDDNNNNNNNNETDEKSYSKASNESEDSEHETEEEDAGGDCCYRCLDSNPCCRASPRCFACILGVVLPLWLIILISLFLGVGLSALEADEEIQLNDGILRDRFRANIFTELTLNFTQLVPRLCIAAYLLRNETTFQGLLERLPSDVDYGDGIVHINADFQDFMDDRIEQSTTATIENWTEFNEFMDQCGDTARQRMDRLIQNLTIFTDLAGEDLEFNWIRCYPGASGLEKGWTTLGESLGPTNASIITTFAAQQKLYSETWWNDFQRIRNDSQSLINTTDVRAVPDVGASNRQALHEASGKHACTLNGPGSAWFWFAIMTTMGFGNQAPQSSGGRAMVFTLGFLSILAFGSILGYAGYIVAAIVENLISRIPYVGVFGGTSFNVAMWALLSYLWLLVIAGYTTTWKRDQAGETLGHGDSYWFAFISTTTVGLGDFFLEPEVFRATDLLSFPLLFLTGFVLLSAFISKIIELATIQSGRKKKKTILDALEKHMKRSSVETNFFCLLKACRTRESVSTKGTAE